MTVESLRTLWYTFKHFRSPLRTILRFYTQTEFVIQTRRGKAVHFSKKKISFGFLLRVLNNGWTVVDHRDDHFLFHRDGISLFQPNVGVLMEDFDEQYGTFDYHGAVVIDVGGYVGETAVFFQKWGAKTVVVFEPVKEHVALLRKNLKLNAVKAQVVQAAVSNKSGRLCIGARRHILDAGFGLVDRGELTVESWSWNKLLSFARKKNASIIKVDCEGYERFLVEVNKKAIAYIPRWLIEAHSPAIRDSLVSFFGQAGFRLVKTLTVEKDIFLLTFLRPS